MADLGTYLTKAIPDTKLTIRRYADAKFAYLSYCLKVKEMDDDEHSFAAIQEPIYRVETGNYEYRLILRCRQEARTKFARLRSDVLEKMELLESKHARDLACQLERFIKSFATLANDTIGRLNGHPNLFPVEVDLKSSAFQYKMSALNQLYTDDSMASNKESFEVENAQEITEVFSNNSSKSIDNNSSSSNGNDLANLISGFDDINLSGMIGEDSEENLLKELGIDGIDLSVSSSSTVPLITGDLLN